MKGVRRGGVTGQQRIREQGVRHGNDVGQSHAFMRMYGCRVCIV